MEPSLRHQARRLATAFRRAVEDAGASVVLIPSTDPKDDGARLRRLLRIELAILAPGRFKLVHWSRLVDVDPHTRSAETVLVVTGPPLFAGNDLFAVPQVWMEAFDAAVLVVKKRETPRRAVEEATSWLNEAGIPTLGVILDESGFPSWRTWLRRLLGRRPVADEALPERGGPPTRRFSVRKPHTPPYGLEVAELQLRDDVDKAFESLESEGLTVPEDADHKTFPVLESLPPKAFRAINPEEGGKR